MELLESYLKAVRRYLPRRHRDDIIAELSDELRQQMEAREAQLGRPSAKLSSWLFSKTMATQ